MGAEERLQELLDLKDRELSALRGKLAEYEEPKEWRWTLHTHRKEDTHDLPVPRLELRCERIYDDTWSAQAWTYCLVYQHLHGHLVWVPLSETKRTGARMDTMPSLEDLPIRDGTAVRHDSTLLNLPAFVVIEDTSQRIGELDSA